MSSDSKKFFRLPGKIDIEGTPSNRMVATLEYDQHDPRSLNIGFLSLDDDRSSKSGIMFFRNLKTNHLWFDTEIPEIPSLEILGIHRVGTSGSEIMIEAAEAQIGIDKRPFETATECLIGIDFAPSGILCAEGIRTCDWRGSIEIEPLVEGRIEAETEIGVFD